MTRRMESLDQAQQGSPSSQQQDTLAFCSINQANSGQDSEGSDVNLCTTDIVWREQRLMYNLDVQHENAVDGTEQ